VVSPVNVGNWLIFVFAILFLFYKYCCL